MPKTISALYNIFIERQITMKVFPVEDTPSCPTIKGLKRKHSWASNSFLYRNPLYGVSLYIIIGNISFQ
jgi:hypothetical protein